MPSAAPSESLVPCTSRKLFVRPLIAVTFALVAYWMFTRHNDFPFYYHTDEPTKVEQVIHGVYNFHHPLLMLDVTNALVKASGTPLEAQPVVKKGRQASALLAAFAVGAMVLLAWRFAGVAAGLLAGALTATHPVLFELAHYMKEDCALIAGIAWTAVALAAYGARPTLMCAAGVGIGAGISVSGKYLGAVMAVTALVAVALTRRDEVRRWRATLVAALAMVLCFAVIHIPGFADFGKITASIQQEIQKVEERSEERPETIKFKHLSKLGTSLSVPLLIGLAYWIARRWRPRGPVAWRALGAFVLVYFLIVSLSPKTKDRYLLPIYVLACALGSAGIVEWARRESADTRQRWIGVLIAVAALAWHVPELSAEWRAFSRDDRKDLTTWLLANVPPTEGIAHDFRAHLLSGQESQLSGYVLPNPIYTTHRRAAAYLGTLDELRARGVTHVVAVEPDYQSVTLHGGDSQRRAFYKELFAKPPAWERHAGPLEYLQPGIRVYKLR